MSHFTVLVVGEDPSHELAPFHEYECTGVDDEFIQDVDVTEKVKAEIGKDGKNLEDALAWYGLDERRVCSESEIDTQAAHKFGYAIVQGNTLIKAVDRTNPNAKWDWYQIGGRWAGYWLIKPEFKSQYNAKEIDFSWGWSEEEKQKVIQQGKVDQARKGHIDFAGMRADAEQRRGFLWDQVHEVMAPHPEIIPWTICREEKFPGNIEAAREFYHQQPAVSALNDWNGKNERPLGFFGEIEPFLLPRAESVRIAGLESICCFAFVKNRQWAERGHMGWWACVSNEKDALTWAEMFNNFIESLKDDELLTVVDCHI